MADLISTRNASPDDGTVVLCATHRLARILRIGHDRAQAARGLAHWQPMAAYTVGQWLDGVVVEALLTGAVAADQLPSLVLAPVQERLLWERIIEADGDGTPESMFFDREGLAAAAADANALIEGWGLRIPAEFGDETRRFLRWRAEFRRRCEAAGWREPVRVLSGQIAAIAGGAGRLPPRILFAGFDRYTPQEMRLMEALSARGIEIAELETGCENGTSAVAVALVDREAECRAAVAWAANQVANDPRRSVGIVVPELSALRERIAAALDDALHPQALAAAHAEMPRLYNLSLGRPLAAQPVVDSALRLLRLAAGGRRIAQSDFGELLRGSHWSADQTESDSRAVLEAAMREQLGQVFAWERMIRFLRREAAHGRAAPRLLAHLEGLRAAAGTSGRQPPSRWSAVFRDMLVAVGWPGERGLSSHEYQARVAFEEALDGLSAFDGILGRIALSEAVSRLARLCRDRVFQPETEGDPRIQIMGPLEAAGMRFDALWVMNMNDDVWPAAASPNPLLPAELQRRAGTPGASAEIEARFAGAIHARLLKSAPEVVFSWAQGEGDRARRSSPLIAGLPAGEAPEALPSFAGRLRGAQQLEALDDNRAPPVQPDERVRGGTGLLQAQAICPAWAFYRYRLGARALGEPVEGLDALARGSLVHSMLEAFWRGRSSADLAAMSDMARAEAIETAIESALAAFNAERDEPLPVRIAALERERLATLAGTWLGIEADRPAAFQVAACEETHTLDIEGLPVRITIDRIDMLDDGRRVILDYKTGRAPDWASWAEPRILEPQLPVYAAWLAGDAGVDAVAFACLRAGEEGFSGIAAESGLLPDVPGLADKPGRKRFSETGFPNWKSVLTHWRNAIADVAQEVKAGVAAVVFEDEKALVYCEVKPLLRLAERRSQQEAAE